MNSAITSPRWPMSTTPRPVAYQSGEERPEPWEPNVTALHDPAQLKWKDKVKAGTPLPTPWPKAEFEKFQREYQKTRAELRAANRPEAEMNALFREEREFTNKLLSSAPHHDAIGAFEGANYQASGYYRSEMQCVMFSRIDRYCEVCQDAIEDDHRPVFEVEASDTSGLRLPLPRAENPLTARCGRRLSPRERHGV